MSDSNAKQVTPADDCIPVTPGPDDLPDGICRGLLIGGSGNITIKTPSGITRGPIPVLQGIYPIKCKAVLITVTAPATNIFALY